MKYNNAVAGYNQTNIGLKHFLKMLLSIFVAVSYNQTNIGLKLFFRTVNTQTPLIVIIRLI